MKKFFITSIVILLGISSFAQKNENGFTIKCNITNLKNSPVKLVAYRRNEPLIVDSTSSIDGNFTFKVKNILIPELVYVVFADAKTYFPMFIENNEMSIRGDYKKLDRVAINGSNTQRDYEQIISELSIFTNLENETNNKYQEAQNKKDVMLMQHYDSIMSQIKENQMKFLYGVAFNKNKSVIAPYIVVSQLIYNIETNVLDSIYKNFDKSIANSEYVKIIKERLDVIKKVSIGQVAPDIIMADTNGVPFKLSSLRGKVILIDFWASWCRPCRGENPNVVAAYNAYKDKGFDILGVSLDQNKASWIKAISDDKLTWHHVSDLKGWQSEAGKLYGVNSIPHSVLLDKRGVIIATDLRGEELLKKLDELIH